MASKRRLRRKSCGKKIRYPDRQTAKLANGTCNMVCYPCQFCGGYHRGHNKGSGKSRQRKGT